MWTNLFGSVNSLLILVSLYGVYLQLNSVWQRKRSGKTKTTHILSQNQFMMSFLAYFSFFVFGYSTDPFNHYLVWPRLLASVLVALILFEMWRDRKTLVSLSCLMVTILFFTLGIGGLFIHETFATEIQNISTVLIVTITLLLGQGYAHQINLILKSGQTGALNIKMSQYILMMDISTIAFSLSLGIDNSWPLMVLAAVSGLTKLIIMYLFRWVRLSSKAERLRLKFQE